jgi:AcrR family transcriptional regulator
LVAFRKPLMEIAKDLMALLVDLRYITCYICNMSTNNTANKIVVAAISTLIKQGVKRASLADVAYEAGVTRVTIYRYFGEKKGLIEAVCRHLADIFRQAAEEKPHESTPDIDSRLERLGEELGRLPPGNLLARLDEIHRLYPAVYEEFRAARQKALDQLFQQAVAVASREHTLREEINLQVAKAMFAASVAGLIENPAMILADVPYAEICKTVTTVLRYGMLKSSDDCREMDRLDVKGM